jgi:MFS family permease
LRYYGRDFALAFAAQFWFTIAATIWAHYMRWIQFLQGTEKDVGWIIGGGAAAALLFRPWIAHSIDRFGSRVMWGVGMTVMSAAALANLALSRIELSIYLFQAAALVGMAIVYAAGLTYITQIAPAERRTEMIGAFGVAGFAGVLIGPYLGDLVLGGPERSRDRFVGLFLGIAAANALGCALVYLLSHPPVLRRSGSTDFKEFARTLRRHWPGGIVWVNFMFGVCMAIPFRLLSGYIDVAGLGEVGIGGFFLAYAGVGILVRLTMRDLPERMGLSTTVLFALVLFAAGAFCFTLVDRAHPYWLFVPAVLCGVAHAVMFHSMVALTIATFPNESRGTGTVLALMMQDLGLMVGLPTLGQLAFRSFNYVFLAVGAGCLMTAAVYAWTLRSPSSSSVRQPITGAPPASPSIPLGDRRNRMGEMPAA